MTCSRRGCGKDHGPLRENEGPSQEDIQRFGDVTRTCPACRKEVFDDAELCYHCGNAIEGASQGSAGVPKWVIVTAGLLLTTFAIAMVFSGRLF